MEEELRNGEGTPENVAAAVDAWLDRREDLLLGPYAARESASRGREHPQAPSPLRNEYQRDRDRIIHSQSFRRLMNKTQVFLAPVGDHYRTRLTHTLEVSQIARTMARALRLNEDLTEAAALGHDLGHTPFGHAGEDALRECYDPEFAHYRQSIRVVERLENDGRGLNLMWEVRDGILNHTGKMMASTLEGVLIKFADRIAYINHDIDDATRAGILKNSDIPKSISDILGTTHSERINTLIGDLIDTSMNRPTIAMSPRMEQTMDELREFMFEHVYRNPKAKGEESKAKIIIKELYNYYINHPEKLPLDFRPQMDFEGMPRVVCDYVAGMTDKYAIYKFSEIFVPTAWQIR